MDRNLAGADARSERTGPVGPGRGPRHQRTRAIRKSPPGKRGAIPLAGPDLARTRSSCTAWTRGFPSPTRGRSISSGIPPRRNCAGRSCRIWCHPDERSLAEIASAEPAAAPGRCATSCLSILRKDGSFVPMEINASLILDSNGRMKAVHQHPARHHRAPEARTGADGRRSPVPRDLRKGRDRNHPDRPGRAPDRRQSGHLRHSGNTARRTAGPLRSNKSRWRTTPPAAQTPFRRHPAQPQGPLPPGNRACSGKTTIRSGAG